LYILFFILFFSPPPTLTSRKKIHKSINKKKESHYLKYAWRHLGEIEIFIINLPAIYTTLPFVSFQISTSQLHGEYNVQLLQVGSQVQPLKYTND